MGVLAPMCTGTQALKRVSMLTTNTPRPQRRAQLAHAPHGDRGQACGVWPKCMRSRAHGTLRHVRDTRQRPTRCVTAFVVGCIVNMEYCITWDYETISSSQSGMIFIKSMRSNVTSSLSGEWILNNVANFFKAVFPKSQKHCSAAC